jgi:hypothetical protein
MGVRIRTKLFRIPGKGGWTFAPVPARHAPPVTSGWGMTPVVAIVDRTRWETSVWRDKVRGTLLPVPRRVRGEKGEGDVVEVELAPRDEPSSRPRRRLTSKRR